MNEFKQSLKIENGDTFNIHVKPEEINSFPEWLIDITKNEQSLFLGVVKGCTLQEALRRFSVSQELSPELASLFVIALKRKVLKQIEKGLKLSNLDASYTERLIINNDIYSSEKRGKAVRGYEFGKYVPVLEGRKGDRF